MTIAVLISGTPRVLTAGIFNYLLPLHILFPVSSAHIKRTITTTLPGICEGQLAHVTCGKSFKDKLWVWVVRLKVIQGKGAEKMLGRTLMSMRAGAAPTWSTTPSFLRNL